MNLFLCLVIGFTSAVVCNGSLLQCAPWKNIEEKLQQHMSHVNCTQNTRCTAMSCVFQKYGYKVQSGVEINACENPYSLNLEVDVPKLSINHWKRKFYHGDTFSLTDYLGGKLEVQKEKDQFLLGLSLNVQSNKPPSSPLLHLLPTIMPNTEYLVFHNIAFPIPACLQHTQSSTLIPIGNISVTPLPSVNSPLPLLKGNVNVHSNCSIVNSSCPINELCQQLEKLKPEGICVCIPDFIRDKSGKCIYNPTVSTTETPGGHSSDHGKSSNTSLLLTAILVPITVIIFLVGITYATIRFRICQHLRRRLRVQVYEHVLLGQDDDEEEDDEASNPVA